MDYLVAIDSKQTLGWKGFRISLRSASAYSLSRFYGKLHRTPMDSVPDSVPSFVDRNRELGRCERWGKRSMTVRPVCAKLLANLSRTGETDAAHVLENCGLMKRFTHSRVDGILHLDWRRCRKEPQAATVSRTSIVGSGTVACAPAPEPLPAVWPKLARQVS